MKRCVGESDFGLLRTRTDSQVVLRVSDEIVDRLDETAPLPVSESSGDFEAVGRVHMDSRTYQPALIVAV
jgi:hypothetical protein